jgi:hypothetical protein
MLKVTTSIALGGVLLGAMAYLHPLMLKELDCSGGGRACPRVIEAENGLETLSLYDEVRVAKTGGLVSPETMRANHNQKMALEAKKDQILGANGRWSQYGRGPLRASGLANTLGLGPIPRTFLQEYAGRVDNFAYDPVARRLFVAVGTGGIWMSEAVGGDVRTIGGRQAADPGQRRGHLDRRRRRHADLSGRRQRHEHGRLSWPRRLLEQ